MSRSKRQAASQLGGHRDDSPVSWWRGTGQIIPVNFQPFEEATGVKVEYEGTRDLTPSCKRAVDGATHPILCRRPASA